MKKLHFLFVFLLSGFLFSCNDTGQRIENADSVAEMATEDTAVFFDEDALWAEVDFAAPILPEPELAEEDVEVRGNDSLIIYITEQDIMFATDKAEIRPEGEKKLKMIADNIKERIGPDKGMIRLYGFTDARASKEYNQKLSQERAQSVQDWLTSKAGFDNSRITVYSKGEKFPEAPNTTPEGRQQNRRVEIVVLKIK